MEGQQISSYHFLITILGGECGVERLWDKGNSHLRAKIFDINGETIPLTDKTIPPKRESL